MPGSASVRHIDAVTPEPANTPVRLFPSISESLYDLSSVGAAATSQPVRDVLALAHREMTMWQRLMPRRLEGNDLLAALLRLHRLAFEAERGALFDRADFYWTEFANLLPMAWESTQAWPTSEIKAAFGREIVFDAHRAFTTTLHRLRRLLHCPEAVRLCAGRLTLDGQLCRVDLWEFERTLRAARDHGALRQALDLYHGPFMGDDPNPWCISLRGRLEKQVSAARSRIAPHSKAHHLLPGALEFAAFA